MSRFALEPAQLVRRGREVFRITAVVDVEVVVGVSVPDGRAERLRVRDLEPYDDAGEGERPPDLADLTPEEWEQAEARFEVIEPLVDKAGRTAAKVKEQAENAGVSLQTVYRWLNRYERCGRISSLVRRRRRDNGRSDLDDPLEEVVQAVIDQFALGEERPPLARVYRELMLRCKKAGIEPCSYTTLRRRYLTRTPGQVVRGRQGKRRARELHGPAPGRYEDARYPLDIVQIDHTQPNVIVVDERDRRPVGRPWLTLAIDVFSRALCGMLVTLEAPSAMSVGLCVQHAVLRKERWLEALGVDAEWPVWGFMRELHADNGSDFRSRTVDMACAEHGIGITWRPLGRADFGGHVERLMGSFKSMIGALPGTTFGGPGERFDYDSERRAVLTLAELERWLAIYVARVYHQEIHSGIDMPPLAKFRDGLLGGDGPEMGLPELPRDERRFYLDFLPFKMRTVQRYGIAWDGIRYWHPSLADWIHARDPDNPNARRKFVVRRDPRDISRLYFLDPDLNDYLEVPYMARTAPAMTAFELRHIKNRLRQAGREASDEGEIFRGYEELKEEIESAARKTKAARRMEARRSEARRTKARLAKAPSAPATTAGEGEDVEPEWEPLGDVETDVTIK